MISASRFTLSIALLTAVAWPAAAQDGPPPDAAPQGGSQQAPSAPATGGGGQSQASGASSASAGMGAMSPDQLFGLKPSTTPRILTLDQALEHGSSMSFDLRIAEERVKQQEAQVRRAWSSLLPNVSAGASYTYNYPEQKVSFSNPEQNRQQALLYTSIAGVVEQSAALNSDPQEQAAAREQAEQLRNVAFQLENAEAADIIVQPAHVGNANVTVSMPIFNGRALPLLQNAYEAVDLVKHANRQARTGLLHAIARSYYSASTTQRMIRIAERQYESAMAHRDALRGRVELGVATPLSLERAELDVVRAEQQVMTAKNTYQIAIGGLGQLLGETEQFDVEDPGAMPFIEESADEAELVSRALMSRPELMVAKSALAMADRSRTDAWMMFMPSVSLVAQGRYTTNTSGFTSQPFTGAITVNGSVPIYDGGARYASLRESASKVREELLKVRQQEARITAQVRGNMADVAMKKRALDIARRASDIARKQHDNAQNLYELGVATSLDVIDANFAMFVSEIDLARAEADLEQSRVGLTYIIGEFPVTAPASTPLEITTDEQDAARARVDGIGTEED